MNRTGIPETSEGRQATEYLFQQLNDPLHLGNAARVVVSCHSRLRLLWTFKLNCCLNFVMCDFFNSFIIMLNFIFFSSIWFLFSSATSAYSLLSRTHVNNNNNSVFVLSGLRQYNANSGAQNC